MKIFGHDHSGEELNIIERLINQETKLIGIIDRLTTAAVPDNKPLFTLSIQIQNQLFIMSDISLTLGTPKTGLFTLTDNKTGIVITTAAFSNQALGANSNPGAATFALDPANASHVIGTAVAAGTGTLVITTDAAWTDLGDGSAQTGSFSVTKNFAVAASADGASFDVVFP